MPGMPQGGMGNVGQQPHGMMGGGMPGGFGGGPQAAQPGYGYQPGFTPQQVGMAPQQSFGANQQPSFGGYAQPNTSSQPASNDEFDNFTSGTPAGMLSLH